MITHAKRDLSCPSCLTTGTFATAERFRGGAFVVCRNCGVYFADQPADAGEKYYETLWSGEDHDCLPYQEKLDAVGDTVQMRRMLETLPRFRWALSEIAKLPRGSKILDIGCGEGALIWGAKGLGHDPHGYDLAPAAVAIAGRLVGNDKVHSGALESLPYPLGTFDCVVCLEVLEHVPSPHDLVKLCATFLKPGGILLLSTPNYDRIFARGKRMLGRPHSCTDYPPHHLTRWPATALRKLLAKFFTKAHVSSLPYYGSKPVEKLAANVIHSLTLHRMGQSLCAVAQRGTEDITKAL